jgi:hypothetical protein
VKKCIVNRGWGVLDFTEELEAERPDILFVNEDGNSPEKEDLCRNRRQVEILSASTRSIESINS